MDLTKLMFWRKKKNIVEIKITEEEKDGRNDQRDDFGRES